MLTLFLQNNAHSVFAEKCLLSFERYQQLAIFVSKVRLGQALFKEDKNCIIFFKARPEEKSSLHIKRDFSLISLKEEMGKFPQMWFDSLISLARNH